MHYIQGVSGVKVWNLSDKYEVDSLLFEFLEEQKKLIELWVILIRVSSNYGELSLNQEKSELLRAEFKFEEVLTKIPPL